MWYSGALMRIQATNSLTFIFISLPLSRNCKGNRQTFSRRAAPVVNNTRSHPSQSFDSFPISLNFNIRGWLLTPFMNFPYAGWSSFYGYFRVYITYLITILGRKRNIYRLLRSLNNLIISLSFFYFLANRKEMILSSNELIHELKRNCYTA